MNILAIIGRVVISFLASAGALAIFAGKGIYHAVTPPLYFRMIGQQMMRIGYFSLPVVGLTAFFTGGALALQIPVGRSRITAGTLVIPIVARWLVAIQGQVFHVTVDIALTDRKTRTHGIR